TIILFDRVRENMGNVKGSYKEVINLSINQVLSRTILTSGTTLAVVLVLFIFNYGAESPLEGIAFTLSVGIIVGTYSSIFIASPLLIWMHNREIQKQKTAGKLS
ncbi:MAG TPA: protein translocase subunit SecF, partial [Planctomycetota bacterium]|nr:protein translocase subunit SecF [Planctomycetota bacterium]